MRPLDSRDDTFGCSMVRMCEESKFVMGQGMLTKEACMSPLLVVLSPDKVQGDRLNWERMSFFW